MEVILDFVEVKSNALDYVMDCLEEACGYGNVVVKGLDAAATQKAIAKLMMPKASTEQEMLERTPKYQARIAEHIAQSRYIHAMKACQDGMAYIEFVCGCANNRLNGRLAIFLKFTDIALEHARCCLAYGDFQAARQVVSLFLGSNPFSALYRHNFFSISEAHYLYGMSMVAGGAENAAAFSFFRALTLRHTHEGADRELDAMETRLALRGSDAETVRVRQNFQTLSTWRHRSLQEGRLPSDEHSKLLSDFLLSDEERISLATRAGEIVDGHRLEVFIDTLDSLVPRESAFIFGGGVRVL